ADGLRDVAAVGRLLAMLPPRPGLATRRTADYLLWRYGLRDLGYRAVLRGASPEDGVLLFRLRRRGRAVEAVVADLLVPGDDRGVAGALVQRLAEAREADYLIRLQQTRVTRD